nr:PEGA domain-containing protein [uncultured Methanoregula sp.]
MTILTQYFLRGTLLVLVIALLIAAPVNAFTSNSLDITLNRNGDATATFRFTLEGLIENAIPQSILEDELKKGLTTSSEAPTLISMDRSSATLLLKKFADTSDVPQGTEYRTATMNFKKAEIALQSSAISSVVSADFSPAKVTLTFPDQYSRQFENLDVLPSVTHTVIDTSKAGANTTQQNTGILKVVSSPPAVHVSLDGAYIGDAPAQFPDIPAGSHTLLFEKEGFEPVNKTLTIDAGKGRQVSVVLAYAPSVSATPASPGFSMETAGLALVFVTIVGYTVRTGKKR